MSYIYINKEEEEYYTKWRNALEKTAYNKVNEEVLIDISRKLVSM